MAKIRTIGRQTKNVLDVVYDRQFWVFGRGNVPYRTREKVMAYLKQPATQAVTNVSHIVDENL